MLVDIVPNHVGRRDARGQRRWWWDLLTPRPRARRYASAFDVDWDAGDGKILVPVVGDDDEGSIQRRPPSAAW